MDGSAKKDSSSNSSYTTHDSNHIMLQSLPLILLCTHHITETNHNIMHQQIRIVVTVLCFTTNLQIRVSVRGFLSHYRRYLNMKKSCLTFVTDTPNAVLHMYTHTRSQALLKNTDLQMAFAKQVS